MAGRIRSIKPEINENKRTAALSSDAWRLFVSLWLEADDYGNLYADPARLLTKVFWAVKKMPRMDPLLAELVEPPPLVLFYEHKGQCYAHIIGWDHQKIDHPGLPRVPGPDPEETERIRERIQQINRERVAKRSRGAQAVLASTSRDARPRSGLVLGPGPDSFLGGEVGEPEVFDADGLDPHALESPPPPSVVVSTARARQAPDRDRALYGGGANQPPSVSTQTGPADVHPGRGPPELKRPSGPSDYVAPGPLCDLDDCDGHTHRPGWDAEPDDRKRRALRSVPCPRR